jgi:hypothetical protein
MRKVVTAVGVVAVLGIGAGFVINNLLRTGDQLGRVGATLPGQTERAAPVPAASALPPRAASTAPGSTPAEAAAAGEAAAEAPADEHGPFGHAADEQLQADQPTTAPDSPPAEATGDATSLAPLLSDTRVRLEGLLADAEPGAADELATLLGARAPIEALLDNPDPAVREEAAALLQLLAKPAP